MTGLFLRCGTCKRNVDILDPSTVNVTKRLVPPEVDHYHPDCYDPWREEVGHGAGDPVNAPAHYRWLPNGIEVIDITETLNFCMGNAIKYILRADHKGKPIEDLEKSAWYIRREIERRVRDNAND